MVKLNFTPRKVTGPSDATPQEPVEYSNLNTKQRRATREQYVHDQGGKCYHCGQPLDVEPQKDYTIDLDLFPPGFLNNPVHLHHSHETGLTLGAVHAYCNAVLWQYYGE